MRCSQLQAPRIHIATAHGAEVVRGGDRWANIRPKWVNIGITTVWAIFEDYERDKGHAQQLASNIGQAVGRQMVVENFKSVEEFSED